VLQAIEGYWTRQNEDQIVRRAASFDLVCIVKSPGLRLCRRLCQLGRPRVLLDINDAVWSPIWRQGDWRDLDAILAQVDGVICENECIVAYAQQHNRRVFLVPDAPQLEVFDRYREQINRDPKQVVIGWIGASAAIGPLYKVLEPLEALFIRYSHLHLRLVGANPSRLPPFEYVRSSCLQNYDQGQMVRELLRTDIGLFPLFHNEDGRGRGTLKAKVYMSARAVAVCEDFGENPKLIQDGVNGVLASTPREWYEKLENLILNAAERSSIAQRGLQTIREQFTARHVFEKMLAVYDEVLGSSGAGL
jgi:glycosyltransferase involved in cell wall biosynthesis